MNTNKLKSIRNNYNKEFTALQDKYNLELLNQVQKDLKDDLILCSGMGVTMINNIKTNTEVNNKYVKVLNEMVWDDGLNLPYKVSNKVILTREKENAIDQLYREAGFKGSLFMGVKEIEQKGLVNLFISHCRFLQGHLINKELIINYN